ncbi:hypothetical protein C0J52_22159, partial [Blattella germanica]
AIGFSGLAVCGTVTQEALCCSVLPVPHNGKRERLIITQMQMFMKWPRIAYLFKADVENDRLVLQDDLSFENSSLLKTGMISVDEVAKWNIKRAINTLDVLLRSLIV